MPRTAPALMVAAIALVVVGSACGRDSSASPTPTDLPALVPAPAGATATPTPDTIADNGIHLHYQVNGAPADVMNAYKSALKDKGWTVTTIVTSGGGGGGGATYTGTNGDSYGVFDGGGYGSTTYVDVCAWASKPDEPNCTRGAR
ncbi:hypothetical protein Mycch_0349 [Mycolicibacterium chubuense NBB4]|uniref:Lipoprotein n=1 Tax=Mycolicibacterium chubuense (strain NBB4) TaxID=710421 RepID=I4BD15_MYCCN|nr:hypothetical protein [Mycolicibacterium chubuense]AFM15172.1 hypothetical protein Mycch_0349 [Mycolicibacterium chubuense NBB4]